ncbi:hypothetical protein [Pseudactinotalea sp. Z1748]|uniref:hypothetical protein n=1 Tax=Pseudactinotalea sp. Z1748 TaxID=3413027 RepID=UPI003C7D538B
MDQNQSESSAAFIREPGQHPGLTVARVVQVLLAIVLLAYSGAMLGFGVQPLAQVNPTGVIDPYTRGLVAGVNPSATWSGLVVVTVAALALCTPVDARGPSARAGLIAGAIYWLCITGLFAIIMVDMRTGGFGPEYVCVYSSCWPATVQQFALAAPAIPTAVTMVLLGVVFPCSSWWWRMLVPPAVFLSAVTTQWMVWEWWIVPLLEGGP